MELTDEQRKQRVEIAQEVLMGIEAGTLKPHPRNYIQAVRPTGGTLSWQCYTRTPVNELNGYPCQACGIGSLAVAIVRRGLAGEEDTLMMALHKFFDDKTLFELEACFMGEGFGSFLVDVPEEYYSGQDDENDLTAIEPWWEKHGVPSEAENEEAPGEGENGYDEWKAKEREALTRVLTAMMENIVRHNGEFVVTDLG